MSFRRMLPFLLINIVVSATVMLAILFWWDNRDITETAVSIPPTATMPLATAVSQDNPSPAQADAEATAPEADDTPTHTVAAGDTLGIISGIYDVSIDDIMTANGMTDPNILSIGQLLIIPVNGLPEPTAVATPLPPTPTADAPPTPIPAIEEETDGETAVIEIQATNGGVASNIETESIQIQNLGGQQVALNGWQLVDSDGHAYTFAQITLFGDGAAIQLHTGSGQDAPADLYWGLTEPIFTTGELLSLLNSAGEVAATTIAP